MKIKKGDKIIILKGKDRGKKGKVVSSNPHDGKVTIEGLNLVVKHVKPKRGGEHGQRVQFGRAVTQSNIALLCPKCNKQIRVGFKTLGDGKKMRYCRKCQATFN